MIKAIIIEDEKLNADRLHSMLRKDHRDIQVIDIIGSVKKAVEWFRSHSFPDVIFLDIQLSDGLGFEIFNHVNIRCPVIFTTAYDEYALRAFKLNSIDYLLKPVNSKDLDFAINQLREQLNKSQNKADALQYNIDEIIHALTNNYKSRFVVDVGMHIRSIEVEHIMCFYSLEKSTFLLDNKGKSYDVNYSLEQLDDLLDPQKFFRINRKYIVNINSIEDMITYSASHIKLKIQHLGNEDILVSRRRMGDFRKWLER